MNDIAIEIKDLWKSFRYEASGGFATLKEVVLAKLKHQRPQVFETELYHGMSLQIKKGETVAFLGRNGSGKSTLLKLISGIYQPDRGSLRVEGRLSPLIELGAGFHPEFSGIENVLIYAQILGIPKKQALKLLPAIIEFSGIGEFANQPVRTYSSGMYMRLAFSVAVNVDPEVLVVDEILAVGDFEFSRKCFARMDEFKRNGKTVCLVSHDLTTVASWATRGIVLDAGRIVYDGPAAEAVNFFRGDPDSTNNQINTKKIPIDPTRFLDIKYHTYPIFLSPINTITSNEGEKIFNIIAQSPAEVSSCGFSRAKWLATISILNSSAGLNSFNKVHVTFLTSEGSLKHPQRELENIMHHQNIPVEFGFAEHNSLISLKNNDFILALGWKSTVRMLSTFEWLGQKLFPKMAALWDSIDENDSTINREAYAFVKAFKFENKFVHSDVLSENKVKFTIADKSSNFDRFSIVLVCDMGIDSSLANFSLRAINLFLEKILPIERACIKLYTAFSKIHDYKSLGEIPFVPSENCIFNTGSTVFLSTSNHQYFDPTLLALKERDFGVIGFSGTEIPQSAEYIAGQLHKAWENSLVNNIEKQWRVNWNPDVPIQLTIPPSELTQYLFEEGRSHAKI